MGQRGPPISIPGLHWSSALKQSPHAALVAARRRKMQRGAVGVALYRRGIRPRLQQRTDAGLVAGIS